MMNLNFDSNIKVDGLEDWGIIKIQELDSN